MALSRGFNTIAGIASETTYGTEIEVTRKIRHITNDLNPQYAQIEDEGLFGSATQSKADQGPLSIGGTLVTDWDYTTSDILFSRFFGTLSSGAYTLDDVIDDKGFTLAIGKEVTPWAFIGCKCSQLVMTGAPGQPVRCAWTLMPTGYTENSSTNTNTVLNALAEPTARRVLFHHINGTFLVGDFADALAAGDKQDINQFTLTINRQKLQFHATTQNPEQARENGFLKVTLAITLPLYQDNVYVAAHRNHTPLQGKVTFTGGSNTKIFRFPNMRVRNAPVPIGGPGLVPRTITLDLWNDLENANTNTEMNFSEPLRLNET